jgi:hypothetical protein
MVAAALRPSPQVILVTSPVCSWRIAAKAKAVHARDADAGSLIAR